MGTPGGLEYSREDSAGWQSLTLTRGQVIEATLPVSDDVADGEVEAGFLVQRVTLNLEGDMVVEARSLGASDSETARALSSQFNRRRGTIHLCGDGCAGDGDYNLHLTGFRLFENVEFNADYLTAHLKRSMVRWVAEDLEELADPGVEMDITVVGESPEDSKSKKEEPKRKPALRGVPGNRGGSGEPPTDPRLPRGGRREGGPPALDREALRERLARVRERVTGVAGNKTEEATQRDPGEPDAPNGEESATPEYSPSPPAELLEHGTHLRAPPKPRQAAIQDKKAVIPQSRGTPSEDKKEKKPKKKKERRPGEEETPLQVAIRDGTTRGLQKQLLERAADAAQRTGRESRAERKKNKKKDLPNQLAKILMGRRQEEKKEKKRRKRRRERKKKGDDYDPGSEDSGSSSSGMMSSGQGSGASSGEATDSSEEKLEAPLKKRSKEKPGSVLGLLVEHARQQLDQSAKVSLHGSSRENPTQGIKLTSYFSVILRPQLGQMSAAIRELHLLANGMDMLRQGDLAILGDLLASRFMSVHQSIIDGGWGTARHMELLPLEDHSAAGSTVVLEARKHARIAARLANQDYWTGSAGARGRGGRGKGDGWGGSPWGNAEQKGKGKKGAKGKGKGKPSWGSGQGSEGDAGAGKTREKVPEK